MFARAERLRHRRDIDRVIKRGQRLATPCFTLRLGRSSQPRRRVTVVASSAVSKSAVVRNRYKRQTRQQLKDILSKAIGDFDLMVSLKNTCLTTTLAGRERQLLDGLKKLKVTL
jgi:ribonuclease P protein component